jgi:hypothetical protein
MISLANNIRAIYNRCVDLQKIVSFENGKPAFMKCPFARSLRRTNPRPVVQAAGLLEFPYL